jgi:hypothetical protein
VGELGESDAGSLILRAVWHALLADRETGERILYYGTQAHPVLLPGAGSTPDMRRWR